MPRRRRLGYVLVGDLPLGAQRQAAFIAALCHSAEVLLLDEPRSGVDALSLAELWDTIRDRSDAGVGVLVTTHYRQEAEQCDRLVLMSDGALVAEGSEHDVIGDTTAIAVRTDDWARFMRRFDATPLTTEHDLLSSAPVTGSPGLNPPGQYGPLAVAPPQPGTIPTLATASSALTVAAVRDDDRVAGFSSAGPAAVSGWSKVSVSSASG